MQTEKTFQEKYPLVFSALSELKERKSSEIENSQELILQLNELLQSETTFDDFGNHLFPNGFQSIDEDFNIILNAYRYFGASDSTRIFINKIMVFVVGQLNASQRSEWLIKSANLSGTNLFWMMDLSCEVFSELDLNPRVVVEWLEYIYKTVKGDYNQRGYWKCMENFCAFWPTNAMETITLLLNSNQRALMSGEISRMISLVRCSENWKPENLVTFRELEKKIMGSEAPEVRALIIESWAYEADSEEVNKDKALNLKPDIKSCHETELTSWLFLLSMMARADFSLWRWIVSEMKFTFSSRDLSKPQRYWVWATSFFGFLNSKDDFKLGKQEWKSLCLGMPPLVADDEGVLFEIDHVFTDLIMEACFQSD